VPFEVPTPSFELYRTIELPAPLRSDGVRDHPGTPFDFPSEQAFSFAGIPTMYASLALVSSGRSRLNAGKAKNPKRPKR
jgi:hypothetical protein